MPVMQKRKPALIGPETWGRKLFVAMRTFRPETPLRMFDWVDPQDYDGFKDMVDYLPVKSTNFILGEEMRTYVGAEPVLYDIQKIHGRVFRLLPFPNNDNKMNVARVLLTELDRW